MAVKRSQKLARLLDRLLLKLPIVGQIMHNSAIARFSRTLAVTFKAGVPLVEALDTVSGATGSVVYAEAVRRIRDDVMPIAGTRLLREWQGVEHTVTVLAEGYEWQGRPYRSLSAIARAITGTRWNGLVFFGLKSHRSAA